MDAIVTDDRVSGVPVRLRFGVQPVDVAGLLAHLFDDPRLSRRIDIPVGTDDKKLGLRADHASVALLEHFGGMSAISVSLDTHHIACRV